MAERPLEVPQPLPTQVRAMARAITGWAHPPRFTTGPATRQALAAAGALGATTGRVVHLPGPPTGDPATSAVLAHELTHARHPVRRPRFLLAGASGGPVDDDERTALEAGRDLAGGAVGAGLVDRLPVGSGAGTMAEVATRAARAAVIETTATPTPLGAIGAPIDSAPEPAVEGGSERGTESTETVAHEGGTDSGDRATADALDVDRVVEAVEDRLLREIERRGGRWAGVF